MLFSKIFIHACLVAMTELLHAFLPGLFKDAVDSVKTHIKILHRRTKRQANVVVAGRINKVPSVIRQ